MERKRSTSTVSEHVVARVAFGDEEAQRIEMETLLMRVASSSVQILQEHWGLGHGETPLASATISQMARALAALPKDGLAFQPRETASRLGEAALTLVEQGIPPQVARLLINTVYNAVEESAFGRYVE